MRVRNATIASRPCKKSARLRQRLSAGEATSIFLWYFYLGILAVTRTLPARYPPGPWPAQMRADMVAAFFDFDNTAELVAAVTRGEAPLPSAMRKRGKTAEPAWSRVHLEHFSAPSMATLENGAGVETWRASYRAPRTVKPLPRYVRRKWLKGQTWAYFFEPPTWARKDGCPVAAEALGSEYENARDKAEVSSSSFVGLMAYRRTFRRCSAEGPTRNIRLVGEDLQRTSNMERDR